jgi:hypothetical protein
VVHEVVPNTDGRDFTAYNAVLEMPGKHNIIQTFTPKTDVQKILARFYVE